MKTYGLSRADSVHGRVLDYPLSQNGGDLADVWLIHGR